MMFILPFQFILIAFFDTVGIDLGLGREIIPLEALMAVMLFGGLLTTATRGVSTYRSLKEKEVMETKSDNERRSRGPPIRRR